MVEPASQSTMRLTTRPPSFCPWCTSSSEPSGVTRYGNGKYQDAIDSLNRALDLSARSKTTLEATDKTFIAMSQHKLGKTEEAAASLAALRELMKHPVFASDQQANRYLKEAESLIGPPTQPEPE